MELVVYDVHNRSLDISFVKTSVFSQLTLRSFQIFSTINLSEKLKQILLIQTLSYDFFDSFCLIKFTLMSFTVEAPSSNFRAWMSEQKRWNGCNS